MDEREKLMERYDDAAFALMMDECAENEGAAFLAEFQAAAAAGELPELPEDIDRSCRDAIKREYAGRERKVRFRQFRRAAARVAVAVFAVIGLLGTLVFSVDAWRIPVLNFIIEKGETYSLIYNQNDSGRGSVSEELTECLLVLLPEGYYLSNQVSDGTMIFYSYQNESGDKVQFLISTMGGTHNIDTEDAACSEIVLNDYKAYFIEKNGYRVIWCNDENILYDIRATGLDKDFFLDLCSKLAEHYR